MKNKLLIILLFCLATVMVFASSCAKSNGNVVTISMSDGAKKYYDETLALDGTKVSLSEEYFDAAIEAISGRTEQTLPQCDVQNRQDETEVAGSKVYTLTSEGYDNVVLYIHGGAWAFEITRAHITFCDDLATRLNAKVYIPLYPLTPEANSDATYAMIETLYKEILKEGKKVFVMGDSAGGNISLGLMYAIKADNLKKPEKMVLLAPCSDMSFTNAELEEYNKIDPTLNLYGCAECAKLWAGEQNLKNPKNSAVYADVTGYPDTMLIQGTNDLLCPDNMILFQKLIDSGVNATLVKGEGLWHVFAVYQIPERETVLGLIADFCKN